MKPWPEQEPCIQMALDAPGNRWIFGDEMGVGKTVEAIEAARRLGADRALVICPAMARGTWLRHFPLLGWAPEDVCMIDINPTRKTQSKKRAATWEEMLTRPIRIVSPELMRADRDRAFLDAGSNPVLILDEGHMFAHGHAKRSGVLRKLTKRYRGALFGTTATPIPNRPIGMFNLFNLVWPRRFGQPGAGGKPSYEFSFHYVERIWGEFGSVPGGLHPDHGEELRERLRWMVSRVTRQEIAHRLPTCQLRPLTVATRADLDATVKEWVDEAVGESTHLVVLTHKRQRGRELAELLGRTNPEIPLAHVDGGVPPTQREKRLDDLRAQPRGIVVATMHSVARSISLSWCGRALLAELYWSPEVLTQVVGRFGRPDGTVPTILDILVGGGTVQERIAYSVADKLYDTAAVLKQGAAEAGLSAVFEGSAESLEQQLLDAALSVCSDAELEMFSSLGGE